nr:MAG TPA: hypothetical protein [Caudoviricetes sp.]
MIYSVLIFKPFFPIKIYIIFSVSAVLILSIVFIF